MKLIPVNLLRRVVLASSVFFTSVDAIQAETNKAPNNQANFKVVDKQFFDLVRELGAQKYANREKASIALEKQLFECRFTSLESCIKELKEQLKTNGDTEIRGRINMLLAPNLFKKHLEKIKDKDEKIAYISTLIRTDIFKSEDYRDILIGNINKLSNETIEYLAKHSDIDTKMLIASLYTNQNTLTMLSKDTEPRVRASVVNNTSTSQKILAELSKDTEPLVRWYVARNTSTSQETLAKLSKDTNLGVIYRVANNTSTSQEILAELSKDTEPRVRASVAYNTSTSQKTLAELSKDTEPRVRESVANNTSTSQKTLAELSKDSDPLVRESVANNTSTSQKTLAELSKDTDYWVKLRVANNTSTSQETLAELSKDTDPLVRAIAQENLKKKNP